MPKTIGYKCAVTGEVYAMNDKRLRGYGNPPSSPAAQSQLPGAGAFPMSREQIDMADLPTEIAAAVPDHLVIEDAQPTSDEPTLLDNA